MAIRYFLVVFLPEIGHCLDDGSVAERGTSTTDLMIYLIDLFLKGGILLRFSSKLFGDDILREVLGRFFPFSNLNLANSCERLREIKVRCLQVPM